MNYEYDGYLQRVLQNIATNFSMKFQMVQFSDHFLTLALAKTFEKEPCEDAIRFRMFIFKSLKQAFCVDLKPNPDWTERVSRNEEIV